MVSVVLFIPRYMMIAGLTVLALGFFIPHIQAMGSNFDFELILPIAIRDYIPTGLKGILIAGLVAAFMSTYAATVNAAPAYIVNDIYKKYLKPNANEKTYVRMSYIISLAVIIVGCFFGFVTKSVDQATLWIVNSLYGGYTAANFFKWYWWRFNGYGYFWGMVAGLASLFIVPAIFPALNSFQSFPIILVLSVIGCLIGTLLTKPEKEEVLKNFYMTVKPWGFWKPIHEKVMLEHPEFRKNTAFKRDMFNVVIGIIWQVTLVVIPIYLVIQEPGSMTIAIIICLITTIILKKNWWDKLNDSFGGEPVLEKAKVDEDKAVFVGDNK